MNTLQPLIYIGNQLSSHGFTPTTIDTLAPKLSAFANVSTASSKRNKIARLWDMWRTVWNAPRGSIILIDTYSANGFHFAWTCAQIARWRGLSYIPSLRGGNLPQRMDNNPGICRLFFENATAIVSPSGYLKAEVEKRFNASVTIIHNNIDIERYPFQEKSFSSIRMLWVRSFHQIYNPEMAVRVLRGLHDAGHSDAILCMIGPDKDGSRKAVEMLSRQLQVDHALEITGRLAKKEWIEKSKAYNIFINTTNFDNTPVSVMEAMALGFPVVTTKVGGIPYLFAEGKEGLMTPPNDTEAMIDAIVGLVSSPKYAITIAHMARRKATQWDWGNIETKWVKCLKTTGI
jgi:glycosyltransferase involved in cell wall biosynthesis